MGRTRNTFVLLPLTMLLSLVCAAGQGKGKPEPPDPQVALGCLRTINTAAVVYVSTYNHGFSPTLAAMGEKAGAANPTPEAAGLIDESLASGKKAGYIFTYTAGKMDKTGWIVAFTVVARPQNWKEGVVSFFSDESGLIRWTNANRAPTVRDPTIDTLTDSKKK